MKKEMLTIREASRLLGITESTLRGWLYEGRMPFYRLGRAIRLKEKDVIAFREKSRIEV